MMLNFKEFLNENNNINLNKDDIVRSMAWLEMLLVYDNEYNNGMSEKNWKNDNRMGIFFQESMKYLVEKGFAKIVENDTDNVRLNFLKWKITENGINELYEFFKVPKTRDEYLFIDNEWLKKYDTKDYKISGIPDSLFERRFQQETRKNITYNSRVDYYKIKDWWEGHQRGTKGWWTGLNKYLGLKGDLFPNVDNLTLYRGINLKCGGPHGSDYTNGEICTKIRNGEIKVNDKITCGKSSWSLLPSVAKSFASGKNGLSDSRVMRSDEVGVILKNTFHSSEMLLDTNWVENHKYLGGGQLFSSEFEVIVKPINRKVEIVDIFYVKNENINEKFSWEKSNISDSIKRYYYFSSSNWEYQVSVYHNENNPYYPFFGFKAKKPNDFFYDMSIITNDDLFKVGKTILDIINSDIKNHNNKGYTFSFTGDSRKSKQRLELYKRFLNIEWKFLYDDKNNFYIITPKLD